MALPDLFGAFSAEQEPRPVVFYETLPPGVVIRQLRQGGLRTGSLVLRFTPDVIAASPAALGRLHDDGLVAEPRAYASNGLSLLVRAGNPQDVGGWADLARDGLRVAFPDPETEGIGRLALDAIASVGGDELRERVFAGGRQEGRVRLTSIHHRQSIAWLEEGSIDAAVVWQTEARYHLQGGRPVEEVPIPPEHNVVGRYAAAVVAAAPHRDMAESFLEYLSGPEGMAVFGRHGFSPPGGG